MTTPLPERVECPICKTSYTYNWIGLQGMLNRRESCIATIICSICKMQYDVKVLFGKRDVVTTTLVPWYTPWRKPTVTTETVDDITVTVEVRAG